jgi:hypothetical protein
MVSDTNFYLWERRFTQGHFAEGYLPPKTVQGKPRNHHKTPNLLTSTQVAIATPTH